MHSITNALKKLLNGKTDHDDIKDPFEKIQLYANNLKEKLKPLFDVQKEWKVYCDPDLSSENRKTRLAEIRDRREGIFQKELKELEKKRPEEIDKDEFRTILINRVWKFLQQNLIVEFEKHRSCPLDLNKIKDPESLGEWLSLLMAQQIVDQCRKLIDRYNPDIQKFLKQIQVNFPFSLLKIEIHDLVENLSRLFRRNIRKYQLEDGSQAEKEPILLALSTKKSDLTQVIEELHQLFITINEANQDQRPELYNTWKAWLIRFDRLENNLQDLINNKIRYYETLEEEKGIQLINEKITRGIQECQSQTQQYEAEIQRLKEESRRLTEENKRLKSAAEKKEKTITRESIDLKLF